MPSSFLWSGVDRVIRHKHSNRVRVDLPLPVLLRPPSAHSLQFYKIILYTTAINLVWDFMETCVSHTASHSDVTTWLLASSATLGHASLHSQVTSSLSFSLLLLGSILSILLGFIDDTSCHTHNVVVTGFLGALISHKSVNRYTINVC